MSRPSHVLPELIRGGARVQAIPHDIKMICSRAPCAVRPVFRRVPISNRPSVGVRPATNTPALATPHAAAAAALAAGMLATAQPSLADVPSTSEPGSNVGLQSNDEVLLKRRELRFVRSFDGRVGEGPVAS